MDHNSANEFSIGVPVNAKRCLPSNDLTAIAFFVF